MKNAIFTLTVFMTALLTGLPAQARRFHLVMPPNSMKIGSSG